MTKKSKPNSKKTDHKDATNPRKKNTSTSSKKPIADRLIELVGTVGDPSLTGKYHSIMGIGRPLEDALASYTPLLKESAKVAVANIANSMVKDGADLHLKVSRVAVRAVSDLDFSVLEARKEIASYGKAGYDGIGAVRFCPVPDFETGATMMAVDAVTLYTGNPSPTAPGRRRRRRAAWGDGIEHAPSDTFHSNDRAMVGKALASIFYPPLTGLPIADPFKNVDQSFAKGCKPSERALVTLMCRSQLPVKKMLLGFGAGKSVLDGVLGRLDYLVKEQCKGKPSVVHRDLVPHFWFNELRRLDLEHLTVPTIRLR